MNLLLNKFVILNLNQCAEIARETQTRPVKSNFMELGYSRKKMRTFMLYYAYRRIMKKQK